MAVRTAQVHPGSGFPARCSWGGLLLGVGIGGLFDGIVLHQILQWHHMLSSRYPPTTLHNMDINTAADGYFHAFTSAVMLVGLFLLWAGARTTHQHLRTSPLIGAMLAGWGLFNVVEGLIDHQLLGVHHVLPGAHRLAYDLGFLLWGAVMVAVGVWLNRSGAPRDR